MAWKGDAALNLLRGHWRLEVSTYDDAFGIYLYSAPYVAREVLKRVGNPSFLFEMVRRLLIP